MPFMSWRDIPLFARSARTDAALKRLAVKDGERKAFEAIYAADPDPWASADPRYTYQAQKYAGIVAALPPHRRYPRALDLGCGLGLLTERLAPLCDYITGIDIAESALTRARARPSMPANASFRQGNAEYLHAIPGPFDLIAIADTLYYLPPPITDARLAAIASDVASLLAPGGLCLLANHYFFRADPDSRLSLRIHAQFRARLHRLSGRRRRFYLVDVLERCP